MRNANIALGDMLLVVISRGYWDPVPGFSNGENQQVWQIWQEMQSGLVSLSPNGRQIIATESEHHVRLQQPEIVIQAIKDVFTCIQK